jgi:transposase InsO family protein
VNSLVGSRYLQMYKCLVEKKTERKIKTVRSDNGTEYTSHYLEDFLKHEGIRHELTVEYTPQQNGVAERKNRSLVETARCLMIQSGLSASFWAEAILTANHIRNRCPSRSLEGEIPFKMWTGRTPIVSYFRKFGTTPLHLIKRLERENLIHDRKNAFLSDTRYNRRHIDFGIQKQEKLFEAETLRSQDVIKQKMISPISSTKKFSRKTQKTPLNSTYPKHKRKINKQKPAI